jgi:hypothetical protein
LPPENHNRPRRKYVNREPPPETRSQHLRRKTAAEKSLPEEISRPRRKYVSRRLAERRFAAERRAA